MSSEEIKIPSRYHVPCVMLLDKSGSMSGAPIAALNEALIDFKKMFNENNADNSVIDICIMAFSSDVETIQNFAPSNEMSYTGPLVAEGLTAMAEAVDKGLDEINRRKAAYKNNGTPYYRPWLVCLTDGASTEDESYYNQIKHRLESEVAGDHVTPFGIGVGEGVDYKLLHEFFGEGHTYKLKDINGIGEFKKLFKFLKNSMIVKSQSKGAKPAPGSMPVATDQNGSFLEGVSFE